LLSNLKAEGENPMKAGVLKAIVIVGGCGLFAFLPWAHQPGRQTTPPPEQKAAQPAPSPQEDGQAAPPKARGVAVRIVAVGSQYAWPGTRVDVFWARAPRSPNPHHEVIAKNVLVLTMDGLAEHDSETANIITVDVTAEQAERLKRLSKVGWLRAFPRPLAEGEPDGRESANGEPAVPLLPPLPVDTATAPTQR
jgi:hypothetical protein